MALTTYSGVNQRTNTFAAAKMLAHAQPLEVLSKMGLTVPMPKNKAQSIKLRRSNPFPAITTAATEGVTPSTQPLSYTDVTATLAQYIAGVEITDVVSDLAEDPVIMDAAELCGEQITETRETLLWNVIKAGTNVVYANGSARNAVNTVFTLTTLGSAVRTLQYNRAKRITKILAGSPNYLSRAIEASFVAVCHTDLEYDIRNLSGFIPVAQYGSMKPISPFELGAVQNVRFVTSPVFASFADAGGAKGSMKSTSGTSADVYPVVIMGEEFFGQVALRGEESIEPRILRPQDLDKSDWAGQRGIVGWKMYWAALRLNEAWGVRVECAVTAL